jgi:glucose/arabinose dehydrogenase
MRVQPRVLAVVPLLAALVVCVQASAGPTPAQLSHGIAAPGSAVRPIRPICDPDNGGLNLPGGFCALVVYDAKTLAGGPARVRDIAVAPNGDVFVADQSPGGGVLALRDTNGDGKADVTTRFGTSPGNGIYFRSPYLYFAPNDRVERYLMSPESLTPVAGPEVIVSGLPATGNHVTKTILVTKRGRLFVGVGSSTDSCQAMPSVPGSLGIDPCPDLPIRAGIWRYDANLPGQVHSAANRYATELRNMVALALNPYDGRVYGVQQGRGGLNRNFPELFTPQDDAALPAEEFFRFRKGGHYGWPYCYYDGRQKKKVLAPEYGGDGTTVGRCADAEDPLLAFPAHYAPNGLLFYGGDRFPGKYRGAAFIAFHGGPNLPESYNVTVVRFTHGRPHRPEVFADGFIGEGAVNLPADADHRAMGLAEGPDGSLYITDDAGGRIWRVLHASRRR